jgi:hypothetical protein
LVDLAEIQAAYYMVAATGVLVAAAYYVMNLRVQQENMREASKNRKIALTNTLLQTLTSEAGLKRYISLVSMEWKDWADFDRKYDSKVNEDNFVMRALFASNCSNIGYLLKEGVIDVESVYQLCGEEIMDVWLKLKPVHYRFVETGDYGKDSFVYFEYLAREMIKMKAVRDPSYKGPPDYFAPEEYDKIVKG